MASNTAPSELIAIRSTYFGRIKHAITSIFEGLSVTLSYLLHKPITVQYPDKTEKPFQEMLPERFRGELGFNVKLCSACLACARACPIDCIKIEVEKDPETKQRMMTRFDIDITKCMYCGLCTEPCPTKAIHHTHEFEGSAWDLTGLVKRFITEPVPPAKPEKKEKADKPVKKAAPEKKKDTGEKKAADTPEKKKDSGEQPAADEPEIKKDTGDKKAADAPELKKDAGKSGTGDAPEVKKDSGQKDTVDRPEAGENPQTPERKDTPEDKKDA